MEKTRHVIWREGVYKETRLCESERARWKRGKVSLGSMQRNRRGAHPDRPRGRGGAGGGTGAGGGGEAVANTMGTPRSYLCSATTNTTQAQLATLSSLSVRQTCTKFAQFRQHAIASGRRRAIPDCVLISSCNAGNLRWFARTQANRAGAGLRGIQRQGTGDRHRRSRHRRRSQRRLQEREREREGKEGREHTIQSCRWDSGNIPPHTPSLPRTTPPPYPNLRRRSPPLRRSRFPRLLCPQRPPRPRSRPRRPRP